MVEIERRMKSDLFSVYVVVNRGDDGKRAKKRTETRE